MANLLQDKSAVSKKGSLTMQNTRKDGGRLPWKKIDNTPNVFGISCSVDFPNSEKLEPLYYFGKPAYL